MSIDDSEPVDLSKPVQTRLGRKVFIYTTEGQDKDRPVVGEYPNANGTWLMFKRPLHGRAATTIDHPQDLVNVPQRHTVTVSVYRRDSDGSLGVAIHRNQAEADENALAGRIACFEHTFTEGEGL